MQKINVMAPTSTGVWIPGNRHEVDIRVWRVDQAVREYDESLCVGQHQENGQWVVFKRMPRGGDWPELFPILGLTEPPHDPASLDAQEVVHRLWNADTRRRGEEMYDWLVGEQDKARAEERRKSLEVAEIGAEILEFAHRRSGTHPSTRVLMNGRTRRGYGESW